ncbi:MAG: type IV pilus assembly protein PilM [Polaromonas sp.]|nr:type IV pilus assembly protein PilM [Polaromonas sp.]
MRFFKAKLKPLIGLDMGSSSLKWVELAQDDKSELVLERCVTEPLQAGWIVDGHIEQFDEVAAALRRLVKASGSPARQVALAMPDSAVITTKILLPSDLGEAERFTHMASEVERLSGQPLTDMNVDFTVQGRAQALGQVNEVEVLIAAASQERVQDRLGLVESAGLTPVVVDVETPAALLATRRLINVLLVAPEDAVALIQIGAEGASLHVIQRGEIVHAARQSVGGGRLTELIAQTYGLDVAVAEDQKCKESLPADYSHVVLQPFIQRLADGLISDLDALASVSSWRKIDSVLLSGGSSVLPGLQEAIQRRTFCNCVLADPFSGMLLSKAVDPRVLHPSASAGMLTACGLALRRFNGLC